MENYENMSLELHKSENVILTEESNTFNWMERDQITACIGKGWSVGLQ